MPTGPSALPPTFCVAGDTVRWTHADDVAAYPAAEGWAFTLRLVGEQLAAGAAVRDESRGVLVLTFAATETEGLPPGAYRWALRAERDVAGTPERATLAGGVLEVRSDPAATPGEGTGDPHDDARHPDVVALARAYARRAELLEHNLAEYATGERRVVQRQLEELERVVSRLEAKVAARRRLAAGASLFTRVEYSVARPR